MPNKDIADHIAELHGQIESLTLVCSYLLSGIKDTNNVKEMFNEIESKIKISSLDQRKNQQSYIEGMSNIISTLRAQKKL